MMFGNYDEINEYHFNTTLKKTSKNYKKNLTENLCSMLSTNGKR
jgi:hypothetical protein